MKLYKKNEGIYFEFNAGGIVLLVMLLIAARWLWLLAEKVLR